MLSQEEVSIQCPFCGEPIDVLIDSSVDSQTYIEDCSVCCRPIQLRVQCQEGQVVSVDAGRS